MSTKTSPGDNLKELYHRDFPAWVERNLELLKEGVYESVDWENLLEEIQDMGQRHLDACISYLAIILEHMYKLDHFKQFAGGETAGSSWRKSIRNSRIKIETMFERFPSLRQKLPQELESAWIDAKGRLRIWLEDNGISAEEIPQKCPYTYQQAMFDEIK